MMNYSVLTTVYKNDNPEDLMQSIDSMLNQTVVTDDYVIVADGPLSNELYAVLEEYSSKYDFFRIIQLDENSGLGVALREGLSKCKNELVARIDADDLSLRERCELQLKRFDECPELAIIGSDMYEFDNDPDEIKDIKVMPHTCEEIYEYGKRRNAFNHSSVMYKKSIVEKYGSYSSKRRSQDVELFSKIIFNGEMCENINIPLIKFRCGDSRVKRKKKWSNVKSDLSVFYSNYKMGYSVFFDYLYVVIIQIGFWILPEKVAGILYSRIFRSKL